MAATQQNIHEPLGSRCRHGPHEAGHANRNRRELPVQSPGVRPVRRRLLEAMARQATSIGSRLRRSAVGGDGRDARGVRAGVVEVGEAPSRAASSQGSRRSRDMIAMGRAVGPRGAGPHVLPRHVQLLPGLERGQAGRDDARHAAAGPSRAGVPHAGADGSPGGSRRRRRCAGRPDRDGLRSLPPRHRRLVGPARPADPGDHRRARSDLRPSGPRSGVATPSLRGMASGRGSGTCSTWAA